MKRIIVSALSSAAVCLAIALPGPSSALVVSINNQSGTAQTLATTTATSTMHMNIVSAGNTHTFQWDNTPWRVNQGGTGATSFTNGSILFYSNNVIAQDNGNLFWNTASKLLGIGTSTPTEKLEVVGNIKLSGTLFASMLNLTGTTTIAGRVGIGNSNPQHALDVSGAIYSRLVTATSSTINWNNGNVQEMTLGGNQSFSFVGGQPGGEYKLILKQDGTGGRTVTWPSDVLWANGTVPTLTSAAGSIDMQEFTYDGTHYLGSPLSNFSTPPTSSIAFDNVSEGNCAASCSSESWSHTTSGSNRILFVACAVNGTTNPITSISYGGSPMTYITSVTYSNASDDRYLVGYYLTNPSSGANNVDISFASSTYVQGCWALSYTGAKQSGVPDNSVTNTSSNAAAVATSLTPVTGGSWIVSLAGGDRNPLGWTNATQRDVHFNGFAVADSNEPVYGSHMTTYSIDTNFYLGMISWSFAPAQ